jgi:hypothetical protein
MSLRRTLEHTPPVLLKGPFLVNLLTLCYVKLIDGPSKPGRLPERPTDNCVNLTRSCTIRRNLYQKNLSTVLCKGSTDASLLRVACSGKHACCVTLQNISAGMKRRLYMHTVTYRPECRLPQGRFAFSVLERQGWWIIQVEYVLLLSRLCCSTSNLETAHAG